MAYKCETTNYSGRLYKEGVVYATIGSAQEAFFTNLNVEADVETGEPDERQEVKDQLDALGVEYNARLGLEKLRAALDEAQADALTS